MIDKYVFFKRGWELVNENEKNTVLERGNYFLILYRDKKSAIIEVMYKDPALELPNSEFFRIITRILRGSQINNLHHLLNLRG